MSRIRSVHPGLWTDERFVTLAPLSRLLFIGIWNECDDQGSFEWAPLKLKMRLLPADNADVAAMLEEIAAAGCVMRYEIDGRSFGAVRNFCRYQRPKKPNSTYPQTDEVRVFVRTDDRSARDSSEPVGNRSRTGGEISPQMKEGGGREGGRPSSRVRVPAAGGSRLPADWALPVEWRDWAAKDRNWREDRIKAEADKFGDFWRGKAGKDGRKADWLATWRNWCRRADEGRGSSGGGGEGFSIGGTRMSSPC